MKKSIENVLDVFAKRIYEIQFAEITDNSKKRAVDTDCRIVSDYLGTMNAEVSHSTPHILKHCKLWSIEAKSLYANLKDKFNISHSQICEMYVDHITNEYIVHNSSEKRDFKKSIQRAFCVEHQFPLGIVKEQVVNKQFSSAEDVKKYLKKYINITIVTSHENALLNSKSKSAKSLIEAKDRYKKLGIIIEELIK